MLYPEKFEVIVVGCGHAGAEAAFDAPVDEKPFPAVSDEAAAAMQARKPRLPPRAWAAARCS